MVLPERPTGRGVPKAPALLCPQGPRAPRDVSVTKSTSELTLQWTEAGPAGHPPQATSSRPDPQVGVGATLETVSPPVQGGTCLGVGLPGSISLMTRGPRGVVLK